MPLLPIGEPRLTFCAFSCLPFCNSKPCTPCRMPQLAPCSRSRQQLGFLRVFDTFALRRHPASLSLLLVHPLGPVPASYFWAHLRKFDSPAAQDPAPHALCAPNHPGMCICQSLFRLLASLDLVGFNGWETAFHRELWQFPWLSAEPWLPSMSKTRRRGDPHGTCHLPEEYCV